MFMFMPSLLPQVYNLPYVTPFLQWLLYPLFITIILATTIITVAFLVLIPIHISLFLFEVIKEGE